MSERSYMNEEIVLCAANAYEQKFYLNPEFDALPESVKQELQIMCVLYTEDVGGILMVVFDEEGNLISIRSLMHFRRVSKRSSRSCAYYIRKMWAAF